MGFHVTRSHQAMKRVAPGLLPWPALFQSPWLPCKGIPRADPPHILTAMQYLDVVMPEILICLIEQETEGDCQMRSLCI